MADQAHALLAPPSNPGELAVQLLVKSLLLVLAGVVFFALAGLVAVWAPDKTLEELKVRWGQPPSQFLPVDGMLVHVRDEGPRDDPLPLVLLHGTSDSLHTWDDWASVLQRQRRVIRFDLPGFGLTGPNADNDYSIPAYVRFTDRVLTQLGVSRYVLVGNSLGGQIAWSAALAHPDKVRQLVLEDAGGYPQPAQEIPLAFKLARVPGVRPLFNYLLPRGLVQRSLRSVYGDNTKVNSGLVERYYDMALRAGNRRALGYRVDAVAVDDSARIAELKLPTLVLWGAEDRLIPQQAGQRFARDIPGSRLVVFDGLGHLPHQEDPGRTVVEVQRFLGMKFLGVR